MNPMATKAPRMKILAVDVGGTHVKILASGQKEKREFASGPQLGPDQMVEQVKVLANGWAYDHVTVGYPGPVVHGRPAAEPHNLGAGWLGFDFARAFGCPTRTLNDAAMQALGGYRGGRMLFLGFGTGLGTAFIVDGMIEPLELGHLPYRKSTYEDYVGLRGLKRHGKKKWRQHVTDVIARLAAAMEPDEVVLGGGNAALLKDLPPYCRLGDNANAFLGGFRAWQDPATPRPAAKASKSTAGGRRVAPSAAAAANRPTQGAD